MGPNAKNGKEECEQDGRSGEVGSYDNAAPGYQDEPIVEARLHQMMMERSVPERQVHRNLDGQEIEPVGHDGHWLERMVSQEGRRQREQSDEEEEAIVQPDERPIRALHDLEPNVMADPED